MSLETYYLSSLSVAATLFSILLLIGIIMSVWMGMRFNKIMNKLEKTVDSAESMVEIVKNLVVITTEKIISLEEDFLQGVKRVIGYVGDVFYRKTVHSGKDKEEK